MRNHRKILALLLSLCMVLALSACAGTPGNTATPTPTPTPEQTPTPDAGQPDTAPVEITWWAFPTFGVDTGYEEELVNAFNASQTGVTVKVEYIDFQSGPDLLTAAMTSGTAPDLLFDAPGRIIEYGNAGYLADINDLIEGLKSDLTSQNLLQTCIGADGNYYMYPISSSPFYMGLNKEALETADALQYVNLEGDRTWTTDNFVKMCEALAKAGATTVPGIVYCGAQGGDQGTRALVANLSGSAGFVSADGKWTIDAGGVEALALLQDMYDKGWIDAGFDMAAADELQKFQNETAAMTFCFGTSNEVTYASDSYTQIAVPFPSPSGKPMLEYLVNGFCVFNNQSEERINAAKEFIKFICDDPVWGPQSVVKTNAFPVRASFGDLYPGDEHKAMLASWSQYYGPYYNTRAGFAAMRPLWFNALQQVFNGTDPQAVADEFNTGANQ